MKKPIQISIIMAFGLLATAGCSWHSVCPDFINLDPAYGLDYSKCPPPKPVVTERQRLLDELDAAQKQNRALSSRVSDLERQLADRDQEIASLRSGAGDSAKQLSSQLAAANSRNSGLEAQLASMGGMAAEMAASKQRVAELESQLAARDKELEAFEERSQLKCKN